MVRILNILLFFLSLLSSYFTSCTARSNSRTISNLTVNTGAENENYPFKQNKYLVKSYNSDESDGSLMIRPLEMTDLKKFKSLVKKNKDHLNEFLPIIVRFYGGEEKNPNELFEQELNEEGKYLFGIWLDKELVGSVGFHSINSFCDGSAEIMYWVDKDNLGKGIVYHSCIKLIQIGFDELHLNRINCIMQRNNIPSKVLAEKKLKFEKNDDDLKKYNKQIYKNHSKDGLYYLYYMTKEKFEKKFPRIKCS